MNRFERRAAFFAAASELEGLTEAMYRAEGMTNPDHGVRTYVQRLIAHLVRADGRSNPYELRFLQEYSSDGFNLRDEEDWVRNTVELHPNIPRVVPDFFLTACRHDAAAVTQLALRMMQLIATICDVVVLADEGEAAEEHLVKNEVISTFYAAVKRSRSLSTGSDIYFYG